MTAARARGATLKGADRLAGEFFREREINSQIGLDDTPESLWEWLKGGTGIPLAGGRGAPPSSPLGNFFYRGQSNADHGLSSSLFRICQAAVPSRVTEYKMAKAEERILQVMREQGLGRLMTNGQLLGLLQHHGIPTRLIDVSKAPLEALFFAVDHNHDLDGRLFVIQLQPRGDETDTINLASQHELEWADAALGERYARSSWTGRVAVADPQDLDPRMRAQQGCFLVGGLIASYSKRQMQFRGKVLAAQELARITTLSIRFPQRNAPGKAWPATAWTVRIPATWKRPLADFLRREADAITQDTMYPPLTEVKRLAASKADELSRTTFVSKKTRN